MAQRERQKAKRVSARPSQTISDLADPARRLESRIKALETERDQLKAELDVAVARARTLEDAHKQALNRIEWVIDSLQNALDK
jgi:uncharacterized protein (DUF3084 family)